MMDTGELVAQALDETRIAIERVCGSGLCGQQRHYWYVTHKYGLPAIF